MAGGTGRTLTRELGKGREFAARARRRAARLRSLQRADVLVPTAIEVGDDGAVTARVPLREGMDLLGVSLSRPPLSLGECAWVGQRVATALAAMHHAGLVHGDIAPGNVVIDGHSVVLVDTLGVLCDDERGTPGFRAPERIAGDVSEAADVYALGALLKWCAAAHALPEVSRLAAVLTNPDPEQRPSAVAAARLCADLAASESVTLDPQGDLAGTLRSQARLRTERVAAGRWWRARRLALRGGVAAASVVSLTVLAGLVVGSNDGRPAAATEGRTEPWVAADAPAWSDVTATVHEAHIAARDLTDERFHALSTADGDRLRATVSGTSASSAATRSLADAIDSGQASWEGLTGHVQTTSVLHAYAGKATVLVDYSIGSHVAVIDGESKDVSTATESAILTLEYGSRGWAVSDVRPAP